MDGPPLGVGDQLKHYRIVQKLGEGGMGVVFLAEDTRLGRQVAIKILHADAAHDPVRRKRFEHEARAAAALSNPGIATVFEVDECDGRSYIVFEFVPGATLRGLVSPGGLNGEALLDIAVAVAGALDAAHRQGVVHRDLKPENVMRTPQGVCKVLDFGLARSQPGDDRAVTTTNLTSAGMIVGTVAYMSPEQLEGRDVDFRSDLFSFGTMLYELATGVHPFRAGSTASTIAAVMTREPAAVTDRNRLQPVELDRVVRKCLRKKPEERYQSTSDLVVDLRNLRREISSGTSSVPRQRGSVPVWWWLHHISTMFFTTPAVIALVWQARSAIDSQWRRPVFLLSAYVLGLHWSVRFALVSAAIGNRAEMATQVRRMRPWIQWTGWPVVIALLITAFAVAANNDVLAAIIVAVAMGGVACLLFLDPGVERAALDGADRR